MGGLATDRHRSALLAGCASAPKAPADNGSKAASNFLPCMVSDAGGFDDKSFNQLGLEGLQSAAKKLGRQGACTSSPTGDTTTPRTSPSLIDQGCNLIVTVGFTLADATRRRGQGEPRTSTSRSSTPTLSNDDFAGTPTLPNIKPILFDTAQAAFLAGYAAASYSKTGVVGTFGGMQIPPVTIFMDGFADGVAYYNSRRARTSRSSAGTLPAQNGSSPVASTPATTPQNAAQDLIDQNADVILPVGGPIYQSAAAAIADSGKDIALIGVDADVFETDPTVRRPATSPRS